MPKITYNVCLLAFNAKKKTMTVEMRKKQGNNYAVEHPI